MDANPSRTVRRLPCFGMPLLDGGAWLTLPQTYLVFLALKLRTVLLCGVLDPLFLASVLGYQGNTPLSCPHTQAGCLSSDELSRHSTFPSSASSHFTALFVITSDSFATPEAPAR